jgi:hypothetical protein
VAGHDDKGGCDPAGRIAGQDFDSVTVREDPVGDDQAGGIVQEDLPCFMEIRCNGEPELSGIAPEPAEDQVLVGTVVFDNEDVERTFFRNRFAVGGRTCMPPYQSGIGLAFQPSQ